MLNGLMEAHWERQAASQDIRKGRKVDQLVSKTAYAGNYKQDYFRQMKSAQKMNPQVVIETDETRSIPGWTFVKSITGPADQMRRFWEYLKGR